MIDNGGNPVSWQNNNKRRLRVFQVFNPTICLIDQNFINFKKTTDTSRRLNLKPRRSQILQGDSMNNKEFAGTFWCRYELKYIRPALPNLHALRWIKQPFYFWSCKQQFYFVSCNYIMHLHQAFASCICIRHLHQAFATKENTFLTNK